MGFFRLNSSRSPVVYQLEDNDANILARLVDCGDNMFILVIFTYNERFPDDSAYVDFLPDKYLTENHVLVVAHEDSFYSVDSNPDFDD